MLDFRFWWGTTSGCEGTGLPVGWEEELRVGAGLPVMDSRDFRLRGVGDFRLRGCARLLVVERLDFRLGGDGVVSYG